MKPKILITSENTIYNCQKTPASIYVAWIRKIIDDIMKSNISENK